MSAPILSIDGDKTLLDANDLMAREHIRHLGVTKDGKLVGMISVRDFSRLSDQSSKKIRRVLSCRSKRGRKLEV